MTPEFARRLEDLESAAHWDMGLHAASKSQWALEALREVMALEERLDRARELLGHECDDHKPACTCDACVWVGRGME